MDTAYKDMEDPELVSRAVDGDYQAFETIVERYQDRAYRLAWSLVKNDDEARDVLQDAFLNVFRKLDTFQGDAKFSSWLYRVVVNAGLMRLRKTKRRSEIPLDEFGPSFMDSGHHESKAPAWDTRGDKVVENSELREKILEAVDELEEKYQTVFLLREMEDLELKEIAEILDITVPAVKSRLHRARLYLRATLEPYLAIDES